MHSIYLFSDTGTSTLRYRNVKELLKVRGHPLFSSVLASSSCVNTIIETYADPDNKVLDAIDMMNSIRADRKHLLLLVPSFDADIFKNLTINFVVTIEHSDGGEVSINIG